MSRQEARSRAQTEVVDRRRRTEQEQSDCYALGSYLRWCEVNGQPPRPPATSDPGYPGSELVMLAFLYAHPGWSHTYATTLVRLIGTDHVRGGHPDPRGQLTEQYLHALKRAEGLRKGRATDALTQEQVTIAPERAQHGLRPPTPLAVRLRGVIAAAEALGVDATLPGGCIQQLPRTAFEIRPDAVLLTVHDRCARNGRDHRRCGRRLDADRQASFYAALVLALEAAGDADLPLAPRLDAHRSLDEMVLQDNRRLFEAWRRAHPLRTSEVTTSYGGRKVLRAQIGECWAADRIEDRVWWLANVDSWLWLRRRDVAYTLAGVVNARRHVELERLSLGRLEVTSTGFRYVLRPHEHKGGQITGQRGGKPGDLVRSLDHLADDPADCSTACPACAMRDHLEVRVRSGAGPDDPLFIGLKGEVLQRNGARAAVRRLYALVADLDADPDAVRVIGTRTLRVTGASLAWQAGMSAREIADEITGHASEYMALLYVRRVDPFSCDLTLSLDGKERRGRRPATRNAAGSAARTAAVEEAARAT
ncbi:hypothetical protein ACI78Q_00285 [Geodermatophilus sp. SYSU D00705]